jgi:hypothetical protein
MSYHFKILTGFRKDQFYSIDADEAHKAYYLFLNPEQRGVFKNGVALMGQSITGIEPDYNAIMGWNPTHQLGDDDWNDIRSKGVDKTVRLLTERAKTVAQEAIMTGDTSKINLPLFEAEKLDRLE